MWLNGLCGEMASPTSHFSPPLFLQDDEDDKVDMADIGSLAVSTARQHSWSKAEAAKRRPAEAIAHSAPVSR